nr:C4-type zinc ribbon domain-containing protein [Kineosphaera limosa]
MLDLAGLDTRTGQLAHRRKNLPQAQRHAELDQRLSALDDDVVRAQTAVQDVQREVDRAESAVQLVRDRSARNQARLDAGQGTPKDLQALQHELASLDRRQAELEDEQLEVMERAEGLDADVTRLEAQREQLAHETAEAAQDKDDALAQITAEEEAIARDRADVAAGVGQDLLDLYEKIRAQTGIGAAALVQRRCGGCQLELMGADLRRIAAAPDDEVVRCEECRRILVRTAESGL